jgi:hypothetical protein
MFSVLKEEVPMSELVMDRAQFLFRERREGGGDRPRGRPPKVFVDPNGRLHVGDAVPETEGPGLSEIRQAVFA